MLIGDIGKSILFSQEADANWVNDKIVIKLNFITKF